MAKFKLKYRDRFHQAWHDDTVEFEDRKAAERAAFHMVQDGESPCVIVLETHPVVIARCEKQDETIQIRTTRSIFSKDYQ